MGRIKASELKSASMYELVTCYYFEAAQESSYHYALEAEIRSRTKGPIPSIGEIDFKNKFVPTEVNPNGEYIR